MAGSIDVGLIGGEGWSQAVETGDFGWLYRMPAFPGKPFGGHATSTSLQARRRPSLAADGPPKGFPGKAGRAVGTFRERVLDVLEYERPVRAR
jgi:hypothetical protein